jgi:SAM-dependent methyltransferase
LAFDLSEKNSLASAAVFQRQQKMVSPIPKLESINLLVKPPTAVLKTHETLAQIDEFLTPPEDGGLILNLGSGSTFYGEHVVNMDIFPSPNVNVVGDAHQLPFRSNSFSAVFCQAVLEHVPRPRHVVGEILRVLKPGGKVYVDVPFTHYYHDRVDFQRYTFDGLIELFRDFEILDLGVSLGPATAMVNQICWTLAALFSLNSRALFSAWKSFLGWILFPLRYLNLLLKNNPFAWQCATAYNLVARKVNPERADIHHTDSVRSKFRRSY